MVSISDWDQRGPGFKTHKELKEEEGAEDGEGGEGGVVGGGGVGEMTVVVVLNLEKGEQILL